MKKIVLLTFICTLCAFASMSNADFKQLQKIQGLIEKQAYKQAQTQLQPLLKSDDSATKAYALQTLASLYLDQQEFDKAIKNYERTLELDVLSKNSSAQIMFVLSQLYLSNEQYKKALHYTLEVMKKSSVSKVRLYENLSLIYYYTKEYKKSIEYTQKLIEIKKEQLEKYLALEEAKQKEQSRPDLERWYKVLYSNHFELEEYPKAIHIINHLIENYESKEEYWMQLVLIYQNQNQTHTMLSTLELAYDKGFINKKSNIEYFINALLQHEIYHKAALLIEKGIEKKLLKDNEKNFKRLVTAHVQAKNLQKAIALLAHSKHAQTQEFQVMLGNLYYNQSDYEKIIKKLNLKLFDNKSKFSGEKDILLALTHYELNQEELTKKYLKSALNNQYERKRSQQLIKQLGYKL